MGSQQNKVCRRITLTFCHNSNYRKTVDFIENCVKVPLGIVALFQTKPVTTTEGTFMNLRFLLLMVMLALGLGAPAAALTFLVSSTPYTSGEPVGATAMCGATDPACRNRWTGNYAIVTGSVTNRYLSPAGWTGEFATVPGPSGGPGGSADLSFAGIGPITSWSFLWGSAGPSNVVQLFSAGSSTPFTVTGANVISTNSAETVEQRINRWVIISADSPFTATFARFTHRNFALENTGHAVELAPGVPEPASWAMLIAGFSLVGATMRRRNTSLVNVSA